MTESNTRDRHHIDIKVETNYLPAHSQPLEGRHAFSYTITLNNLGQQGARLQRRHWFIEHGNGQKEEVEGEGVVGEFPNLQPGEDYIYTSGTLITGSHGSMHGHYNFVDSDGVPFIAEIPRFYLVPPTKLH